MQEITLTPLQQKVYDAEADIVGFGGSYGIGKATLAHYLAYHKHRKSIIFGPKRYELINIGNELFTNKETAFMGSPRFTWEFFKMGGSLRVGELKEPHDSLRYRGGAWDGMFFVAAELLDKREVFSAMAWNRLDVPSDTIKPRSYFMFNKPYTAAGMWLYRFFAPWIDPDHKNPAEDGEIRWFVVQGEHALEVADSEPVTMNNIEGNTFTYKPLSMTFYRGGVNEIIAPSQMMAHIHTLPDKITNQLLEGF